jgi:hypothetical protein
MPKIGLAGGSYTTQSPIADSSRTINWYPERIESGRGKSGAVLYPTPGLSVAVAVGAGPMRGSHVAPDGRVFTVSGDSLYEIDSAMSIATGAALGAMATDNRQCSIASGTYQTVILSSGRGYIYDRNADTFAIIADVDFPGNLPGVKALKIFYVDSFFFVLADNYQFYISSPNDATAWAAIDTSRIEFVANKPVTMFLDHRDVYIFMTKRGQALYNSGAADFPFTESPNGLIEYGTSSPDSIIKMDNSMFMLGENDDGGGLALRFNGFNPQRVSDHGFEHRVQRYIKSGWQGIPIDISLATSWSYQLEGHQFWVVNIPGAETSLVYDANMKLWHEWAYFNIATGRYEPHRAINHIYAFNKHLVGDRELGILYELDNETYTDNGAMIRRLRQHPHINAEGHRVPHRKLQIDIEPGVGLDAAIDALGYDPQLTLQYSDDGGKNFDNERSISIGKRGEFQTKIIYRDLGSTDQSRVYRLIATDPVPFRLIEGYLDIGVGS